MLIILVKKKKLNLHYLGPDWKPERFQSIAKGSQKSKSKDLKKNNVTGRHAKDQVIHIFDRFVKQILSAY